jgi:hypothetical protein
MGNQALEHLLSSGSVLLSWQQHHGTKLPEANEGNKAPKLLLPAALAFPSKQQSHRTVIHEAYVGNQALNAHCL